MPGNHLLRIEGISFDATVFDTDDLSTTRGSSWALLALPDRFRRVLQSSLQTDGDADARVETVYAGASQGLYSVTSSLSAPALEVQARTCLADPSQWAADPDFAAVLPHLILIAVAEPETDGFEATERRLRNRTTLQRLETLDVAIPDLCSRQDIVNRLNEANQRGHASGHFRTSPGLPCAIDNTLPRAGYAWRSTGDGPRLDVPVSAPVLARKTFGRTGRRHAFYEKHAGKPEDWPFGYADSFEEIAFESPDASVPERLRGRMAVLYMDGNRFGLLRRQLVAADDRGAKHGMRSFSDRIEEHREELLSKILDTVSETPELCLRHPAKKWLDGEVRPEFPVLRMETLIWGGDECLMVFPAWGLATILDTLSGFLRERKTGSLEIGTDKYPLSYGIGVVLCHYKTPIRRAKAIAEELCESAKRRNLDRDGSAQPLDKLRSHVDLLTLAGYEIPMNAIANVRERSDQIPRDSHADVYALPLDRFPDYFSALRDLRGISGEESIGIPRKRLFETMAELKPASRRETCNWTDIGQDDRSFEELFDSGKYLRLDETPIDRDFHRDRIATIFPSAPMSFLLHLRTLWDHLR